MKAIGKMISDRMNQLDMSPYDMQRLTAINASQIYRYIRGEAYPTFVNAIKISRVLGISLDALAEGVEV